MLNDQYQPNIAIHPGETLRDILTSLNISQVDLADRAGLTPKTINEIVKGKNPITPDTAIKLASVFGTSATFWNNLERNYQETLMFKNRQNNKEKNFPLKMIFSS